MFKKIFLFLFVLLIAIQFFRPQKNINPIIENHTIAAAVSVPLNISATLRNSCYDCHSNNTSYPWYNNIQPVAWFLNNHIKEAKRELNFDEFATYRIRRQYKKLEETIEQIENDEMPLSSYTLIHTDAALNEQDKKDVITWAKQSMELLKTKYPADSFVVKK